MKIKIEVDLTPVEARRFLGLPDLEPIQQEMLASMRERLKSASGMLDPETYFKVLGPLGAQGLEQFQKILTAAAKGAMGEPGSRRSERNEDEEETSARD